MGAARIVEHMEIIGACGHHVGTVGHVEGDMIRLKGSDSADGRARYLPLSEVAKVENGRVVTRSGHLATLRMLRDRPTA